MIYDYTVIYGCTLNYEATESIGIFREGLESGIISLGDINFFFKEISHDQQNSFEEEKDAKEEKSWKKKPVIYIGIKIFQTISDDLRIPKLPLAIIQKAAEKFQRKLGDLPQKFRDFFLNEGLHIAQGGCMCCS